MDNKKLIDLAVEALCPQNDGYVKKEFISRLEKEREKATPKDKQYIEQVLSLAKAR